MDEISDSQLDQDGQNRTQQDAQPEESRPQPHQDDGAEVANSRPEFRRHKPIGRLDSQQVKELASEEVPLLFLVEILAPAVDSILEAAVFSAGSQLSDPGSGSLLAIFVKVVLYGFLRVVNQFIRDESGSTRWLWAKLFRGVYSAFHFLVQSFTRKPKP